MKIIPDDEQSLDDLVKRARSDSELKRLLEGKPPVKPKHPLNNLEKVRLLRQGLNQLNFPQKKKPVGDDWSDNYLYAIIDWGLGDVERSEGIVQTVDDYFEGDHPVNAWYRANRAIALEYLERGKEAKELAEKMHSACYVPGRMFVTHPGILTTQPHHFDVAVNAAAIIACKQVNLKITPANVMTRIKEYFPNENHLYKEAGVALTASNAYMSVCERMFGNVDEADKMLQILDDSVLQYKEDHIVALDMPYGKPDIMATAAMAIAYLPKEGIII
jgi:hypothetical protein